MKNTVLSRTPTKEFRKAFSRYIADNYGFVSTFSIGKSVLGESIEAFSIGCGKHHVLSFGAHHGLEYISTSALWLVILDFAENLTRGKGKRKEILEKYKELFTFWFVPCLNPDGVDINLSGVSASPISERILRMIADKEPMWQANARGVDLNHNYDYRFTEYKLLEGRKGIMPGRTLYSGEYPESEPETRAAANIVRTLAPTLLLTLHSQGEEIFSSPRSSKRVSRFASSLASVLDYRVSKTEGSADFGGLSDYAGEVLGIPSFTVELGKGTNPLPNSKLPSIYEKLCQLYYSLPELIINKL